MAHPHSRLGFDTLNDAPTFDETVPLAATATVSAATKASDAAQQASLAGGSGANVWPESSFSPGVAARQLAASVRQRRGARYRRCQVAVVEYGS